MPLSLLALATSAVAALFFVVAALWVRAVQWVVLARRFWAGYHSWVA